jgi:outer membrane protein assembly factor BamB
MCVSVWLRAVGCFLSALALLAASCAAGDWPQFLGPERTGVSDETGLLDAWPDGGPREVWRAKGGVGMSGLAISAGKLLTLVERDGKQCLAALDAKTGKPLWLAPLAPAYKNSMGDGPRGTPTIAGERAFAFTGEGILAAVNLADGKLLWSKNVPQELKGKPAEYGMACSPLVVGERVVVFTGAADKTLAAYDVASGELAWTAGTDPTGYSSPLLAKIGDKSEVVAFSGASVIGVDPTSGKQLWRYPYETDYFCNTANPVVADSRVVISAGENHGSVLLDVGAQGEEQNPREVWSSQGAASVLRSEWQTPVLVDGKLYGFDNVGSAGPVTHLTCIDPATGKRVWQQPRFGKGNLIAADGKLFCSTMKGELVVVRATPDGFQEIGRKVVLDTTRQAPALADGLLYLRDDESIVCLDVRKP